MLDVACGDCQTVALSEEGIVYTWGSCDGISEEGAPPNKLVFEPVPVAGELRGRRVIEISCGAFHTGVLTQQGLILMWGANDEGQLGLGHTDFRRDPQVVTASRNRFSSSSERPPRQGNL
jgi:alpha-tubulin suppressor-like RCC1 family protein